MSYMMLTAPCHVCRRPFMSNPDRVPSVNNEPICEGCMVLVNEARVKAGMEPFPVPADAYEPQEVP